MASEEMLGISQSVLPSQSDSQGPKMANDTWPLQKEAREYLEKHKIMELFNNMTSQLIFNRPGSYMFSIGSGIECHIFDTGTRRDLLYCFVVVVVFFLFFSSSLNLKISLSVCSLISKYEQSLYHPSSSIICLFNSF